MSAHNLRKQEGEQPQHHDAEHPEFDAVRHQPRTASSGLVIRSALRAGQAEETTTPMDNVLQSLRNCFGG